MENKVVLRMAVTLKFENSDILFMQFARDWFNGYKDVILKNTP